MSISGKIGMMALLACLCGAEMSFAQRRVFTNEDIQTSSPAAPAQPAPAAQPAAAAPGAPADQNASAAPAPADENAAKLAAAQAQIKRMEEIRSAMREALDIFFDKIREGTASEPTINKWNQIRDNLVLAADELGLFINEAQRNLPQPSAPAQAAGQTSPQQ